jgi:hypothetical protein
MPAITNCTVTKAGTNVITAPTNATLNDDMKPTMNIVVTGGVRPAGEPKKNVGGYKITGQVNTVDRTFISMTCEDAGNAAKFKKV